MILNVQSSLPIRATALEDHNSVFFFFLQPCGSWGQEQSLLLNPSHQPKTPNPTSPPKNHMSSPQCFILRGDSKRRERGKALMHTRQESDTRIQVLFSGKSWPHPTSSSLLSWAHTWQSRPCAADEAAAFLQKQGQAPGDQSSCRPQG